MLPTNHRFLIVALTVVLLCSCTDEFGGPTAEQPCDTLAADPYDLNKVGTGVPSSDIKVDEAKSACEQALAESPDAARFQYQLARIMYASKEYEAAFGWLAKSAANSYAAAEVLLGNMYIDGTGTDQNPALAQQYYGKAAEHGDMRGWTNLGWMFETGTGVGQDYEAAISWYRKAAEQNDPQAQSNLALMYQTGAGVEQDLAEAVRLYELAAVQDHAEAIGSLGGMYMTGSGVELDDAKALELLGKASEAGNAIAQINLASMYENGYGVAKDYIQAFSLYLKAAAQGYPAAQNKVAYLNRVGRGIPQDNDKALTWYQLSADQGDPGGQTGLGYMHYVGLDYKKTGSATAHSWFQKAADQDYAEAQYWLARQYKSGHGVSVNSTLALEFYTKAANQGYAEAQNELAALYGSYSSNDVVEQNPEQAVEWYRKSAEQGNRTGQYQLGWAYNIGRGVPKDAEKTVFWWSKAASSGSIGAADELGHFYVRKKDYTSAAHWYRISIKHGSRNAIQSLAEIKRKISRPKEVVAEISSGSIMCVSVKGIYRAQAISRANNPYALQSDDCLYLPRPRYISDMTRMNGGIAKVRLTGASAYGYALSHNITD